MRSSFIGLTLIAATALTTLTACGDDGGSTPSIDDLSGSSYKSTSVEGFEMVAGTDVTFTFDGDGISVNAGCNTMFGGIEINDGVLSVGPMASTRMACDEALMEQDAALIQFLEAGPKLELDDDVLTLIGADATITAEEVES